MRKILSDSSMKEVLTSLCSFHLLLHESLSGGDRVLIEANSLPYPLFLQLYARSSRSTPIRSHSFSNYQLSSPRCPLRVLPPHRCSQSTQRILLRQITLFLLPLKARLVLKISEVARNQRLPFANRQRGQCIGVHHPLLQCIHEACILQYFDNGSLPPYLQFLSLYFIYI